MRKLINRISGGEMWVADDRYDEYLRAGHKPALDAVKPTQKAVEKEAEKPVEEKKPEPVKPVKKAGTSAKQKGRK